MKYKPNLIIEPRFEDRAVVDLIGRYAASVCASLEYYQSEAVSKRFKKIVFAFLEGDTEVPCDEIAPKILMITCPIRLAEIRSHLESLKDQSGFLQRSYVADIVRAGFKSCTDADWDNQDVDALFARSEGNRHLAQGSFAGKDKTIRGEKHHAEIEFVLDDYLEFFLVVSPEDSRIAFTRFPPALVNLNDVSKLTWLSEDEIRIDGKSKDEFWTYGVADRQIEFHSLRAENGDAQGQYDLGMRYLDGIGVLPDKATARTWLERSSAQGFERARKALAKSFGEA